MNKKSLIYWLQFWFIILFSVVFSSSIAFSGSPFYLTVERSFSNTEKPQIRLDYTVTDKPILVRVLKPEKLESFLYGQFNISRSYEKPITELNPGYYFVNGLNKVKSPLKTFRDMLDVDFRKSFKETQLHKSIVAPTQTDLASSPQQVIIAPPDGFTVEKEFFVDLQYGGKSVNDFGWWFWDSSWDENHYKIRTIALDPLSDGIYLIHAVQGKTEAQSLLQISSLSMQVKQSTSQLVVRIIDRDSKPVEGATVSYRDGRGKWIVINSRTDKSGEITFLNPEGILDGKLIIKAQITEKGSDGKQVIRQALTETDFLPSITNDDSVFIVTDRPIFKPGETFFYKGVIRSFDNGELKVPDVLNKAANISLIRTNGALTDLTSITKITDFGTFSGKFDLSETEAPGLYRLVAEIDKKPYGGEFRVRDYVKPVFYLELIDRSPTVVPGKKFFVKFKTKRYSGGIPQNVKYEVYLYRKKFEAPQWLMEAGEGLSAGTDYFGEVKSVSPLTEPKRIYSSAEERLSGNFEDKNPWDTAPKTDVYGEAKFEFDVPMIEVNKKENLHIDDEWTYTLMIRGMYNAGSQAVLTENIYATLSEAQALVHFSKPVALPVEKEVKVLIRSVYPDAKPAPKASGVIDIAMEQVSAEIKKLQKISFTTDEKGIAKILLSNITGQGRLSAQVTLEAIDGKAMNRSFISEPAFIVIAGTDGLPVIDNKEIELYCDKTILSPGEKGKVLAIFPLKWGQMESGTLFETIAGRKVYCTKSTQFKGRSHWFEVEAKPEYGTGFYYTVTLPLSGGKYCEKTLGFRIIPLNKRLDISILPQRSETEPLKPFKIDFDVKDKDGNPAKETELAVTIVDKAVYAVQNELRPGIFDFFYPLPRLNLATFYSDELQGFGYADTLKKPNFKLGALKSQSKLTKKNMQDTAGWFPHVITDASGHASITVDMPANITQWVITAIAADKTGRAGEAKSGFRTVTDVSTEVLAPQFLREGENAKIFVKVINHLDKSIAAKAKIELSNEILLIQTDINKPVLNGTVEFKMEKQGEYVLPLMVEAKVGKGIGIVKAEIESDKSIHVGGVEEFEIPLKPAAMKQVFAGVWNKDRFITDLPKDGEVNEIKIQVNSGLLGAALNAASVLVVYPFGCTEQLVHTTIPNLVLMDLIKKAGIEPKELGPLAKTLITAERNASAGIKKIIGNQKADGGFSLWPTDSISSIPVTLTAIYALQFAELLNIEGASNACHKGIRYLSKFEKEMSVMTYSGYELSRFAEIQTYIRPWEKQISYVLKVHETPDISISDLINALKIFAAYKDQNWNRFNQQIKDEKVKNDLIKRLITKLNNSDAQTYEKDLKSNSNLFASLGFCYRIPYLMSSALGVLKELNALPEDLEREIKIALISSMKNGYWISTFDTAQVIFNARKIISKEAEIYQMEKKNRTRTITAYKKDGIIGQLSPIPAGFTALFPNPGTIENLTEVRLEGLQPFETAYLTISVNVPFSSIKSRSQGLTVERAFLRITPKGHEILDSGKTLKVGDVVVSEVHVKRDPIENAKSVPSHFIVLEDAIPSYAQGIDEDKNYLADANLSKVDDTYWSSIKEILRYPDKTVTVANVMPSGELRIYQVYKVVFEGKAAIPPAFAHDMYDDSIQGNGDTTLP